MCLSRVIRIRKQRSDCIFFFYIYSCHQLDNTIILMKISEPEHLLSAATLPWPCLCELVSSFLQVGWPPVGYLPSWIPTKSRENGPEEGAGLYRTKVPAQGIAKCPCEAKALKEKQNGAFLYCIIRHLEGKKTSQLWEFTVQTFTCL